jgi:hypothetical protein
LLGQNSWLVLLAVSAALVAARRNNAGLAGGLLAVGLVKPHLVALLVLGIGLRSWRLGRWRTFVLGLLGTALALLLLTLLVRRAWVPALLAGMPESWNYWGSTVTSNTLIAAVAQVADPMRSLIAIPLLLLGGAVAAWLWCRRGAAPAWRAAVTVVLTFLVTPYAYPHDYILLLIPVLFLLGYLWSQYGATGFVAWLCAAMLVWVLPRPWVYDPSRFVTLLAPALLLAILIVPQKGPWASTPAGARPTALDTGR